MSLFLQVSRLKPHLASLSVCCVRRDAEQRRCSEIKLSAEI